MGQLLQDIFLSDFVIITILGGILLLVTWWAFQLREMPGYILGWLIGIFLIILFATATPTSTPPPSSELSPTATGVNLAALLLVSFFGLIAGFGGLLLIRGGSAASSRAQRSLTVAVLVAVPLAASYPLLLTETAVRLLIAIFVLTFAIGAMLNFILLRNVSFASISSGDEYSAQGGENANLRTDNVVERRLREFRERIRNGRPGPPVG